MAEAEQQPPTSVTEPAPNPPLADGEVKAEPAAPKITLDQLVNLCIEKEASDLHFREGGRVALRVGGKLIFIENVEVLGKEQTEAMVNELIPDGEERKRLESEREIDFSYTHKSGVNFRVNVFYQQGKLAGVMRMICKHIPSLDDLGVPAVVKDLLNFKEGLILVCGTAGSGKSTTIQSMLSYINENFVKHVLTIENPIEQVFEGKKSMFTQREVGKDTLTIAHGLQYAVREDANVVMVSEINNFETLDHILNLVETGHLVIGSMMTRDVTQTIERMASFYPQDLRKQAQDRISSNLLAVLAQDLVERQDQAGLIAVFELMLVNQSIRNVIKRGNFVQLRTAIQAAEEEGMITMDNYAYHLADQGIISQDKLAEFIQREE